MAIANRDQYIASSKQNITIAKLAARTTVAAGWFTMFDVAGNPGSGTLAGTSTTAGVVPTDATAGCPTINDWAGGAVGYLTQVEFGCSVAARIRLMDMLFKAGAYGFAAGTTTLSSQPSYSSRVIGGTDFTGTQIWIEVSTAFATGTAWQVQVTYTNQSGTTGRSTVILPATAAAGLTLGRTYQLALQAGDTGVQKIESVIVTNGGTAMTAGAFNVLVHRNLWTGRVKIANDGDKHDLYRLGDQVFQNAAIVMLVAADSTSSGIPELELQIASA